MAHCVKHRTSAIPNIPGFKCGLRGEKIKILLTIASDKINLYCIGFVSVLCLVESAGK